MAVKYDSHSRIPLLSHQRHTSFKILHSPIHIRPPADLPLCGNVQKVASKIPVVSGKLVLAPILDKCKDISEINLSAAARRQKYHLSRYPATESLKQDFNIECLQTTCSVKSLPYHKFLPPLSSPNNNSLFGLKETTVPRKIKRTKASGNKSSVTILPPIDIQKNIQVVFNGGTHLKCCHNSSTTFDSQLTKKKKGLLGEFTHFPTVYNVVPIRAIKHKISSCAAVLPQVVQKITPTVPPPSVSSSIEQEEITKEKMQNLGKHATDETLSSKDGDSGIPELQNHPFHAVSIVVEPVDVERNESHTDCDNSEKSTSPSSDIVKTLMDLAELRKEAFARLLEEHAEIVQKIKKAETVQI